MGPIHRARNIPPPSLADLRAFYARAFPRLDHEPVWFDEATRALLADDIRAVARRCTYTVWAFFIGCNHTHLCIRAHRDSYQKMWENFTGQTRTTLAALGQIDAAHPLWAERPYSVYCYSPADIRRTIRYIEDNPAKEGLPEQRWDFVAPYDGWPARK